MCDATVQITRNHERITEGKSTVDFVTALLGVLLAITMAASVEYYRQVRNAQREYEKARGIVEDIVLSFDRELKREADKLDVIAFKIEGNFARVDSNLKKVDTLDKRISPLENQLTNISQINSQSNTNIISGLTGLELKIKDIATYQETVKLKIAGFEDQIKKLTTIPESGIETVMPIRRDKAMATLTDTEISVLEMLSSEGPKTAPEIKEKVRLSREHTARLMKKLYEEGYLEREVGKIPFSYSIKKEMEKLLRKSENSQTT